jgi:capsular exopolysaccharide synthesis family protein
MVAYLEYRNPAATEASRPPSRPIHEIALALRRRQWLIVGIGLLGFSLGAGGLLLVPPVYTAESSIVLDARKPRVVELPGFVSEQKAPEVAELRSEVEVLQSEDLIRRVIERLDLKGHGEFRAQPSRLASIVGEARAAVASYLPWLAAATPADDGEVEQDDPEENSEMAMLQAYRKRLNVANDGRSYVIRVQYKSHDPALAAQIVNTHVRIYLDDQVAYKRAIGHKAAAWLKREIEGLENTLQASEMAVQEFRERNQIVLSGGTTLLSQQVASVNSQIPEAEADLAARESRLKHARELLRKGRFDTESQVLDSIVVQNLRQQESVLIRRQAELRTTYGEQHPAVMKVDAELRDLRQAMGQAVGRIVSQLENEVAVARTRDRELRARLFELEKRSLLADRGETKLRELEREVTANRSLMDVLLTRYKQVSAQEEIQQPDARIISTALAPINPSFPKFAVHLPILFIGSTLFGVVLAFLREFLQRGFKGSHEIEAECELPSLGSVPIVPCAWWKNGSPHDLVIERPRSSFTEAIRSVRNSIQAGFSVEEGPEAPRTLLVTSSLPNEGKSVLALSLARSAVEAGKRTLLIDCDLRTPSLQKMIGPVDPIDRPDLSMVLNGQAFWADAVRSDVKSGLSFIAGAGSGRLRPDLLSSRAMHKLVDQARQLYDLVILDSPPITAVSDPLTLARFADATVLVVRWGTTPREIAKTSLNKLFQNGARLCGVVLTQVDMRRGVFSPAEVEYYQYRNRTYYAE